MRQLEHFMLKTGGPPMEGGRKVAIPAVRRIRTGRRKAAHATSADNSDIGKQNVHSEQILKDIKGLRIIQGHPLPT